MSLRKTVGPRWDLNPTSKFAHKIEHSDIDVAIERSGSFFIAEGKQVGERIKEGQWRLLDALDSLSNFTVYSFIGAYPSSVYGFAKWGDEITLPTSGAFPKALPAFQAVIADWLQSV